MAVNVGSAVGYLDLDISGFLSGLGRANSEADKQTKNIATKVGGNLSGIGKSLTSAGTTLTKNLTVPLLGISAAGIKVAIDFEKGMSEVKAISGSTGKDFDNLREKALELGADTAFSATEVAGAMTEMAKAGWDSQQIIDGMGGVLDAAAASGESLATVSTIVADAITGFGMKAKESTRVADLLTQAANGGTIGITDLGESFKYIAPVADSMGLSIEDVTTALAAMSKAGIKGSQAGTSLRGVLTRMIKPTDQVAAAMSDLGIVLTEQDGSFKSLDTIIGEMRGSFNGLTDEQKAYYAATLAGQEGMSGLLSLLNMSQEEYDELAKSMDEAGGVAAETAAIMQDNLGSKIEQFIGSLETLAIKLGDFVIPHLKTFVEWLTKLVDKFINLSPETQKTILKFVGLVAIAGPVLVALGKITSAVGGLFTAFGKLQGGFAAVNAGGKAGTGILANLGGAFASVTAPVVAVIAVIAVLAAAFTSLWKNNEEFRENITGTWNQIKETFSGFADGIVERLNSLGFDFENITQVLQAAWQGFCDFLAPIFEGAFETVANILDTTTGAILAVIDTFIAIFQGDWEGAWEGIKSFFSEIWEGIKAQFDTVLNTMKGLLDTVCGWFGTTWDETWSSIESFFTDTWNSISSFATTSIETIKTTISDGFNSAWSIMSGILDSFTSGVDGTFETIKTTVFNAIEKLKSFFNFEWSLPKIKLPHFSISGSFSLSPPSIPKFSVSWYKKAMGNGMILDSATIFGFNPKTGKFLGGGEAGSETVVGTKSLLRMIKSAVAEAVGPLVEVSRELARASIDLGYVTYNGFVKLKEIKEAKSKVSNGNDGNGDTFVFYSPKAIDEIEAAKQMKKTKRELAEGF